MNTNSLATSNAEALARIAAIARKKGVTPNEFRTKLVQEFSADLADQLSAYLHLTLALAEAVSLVSPARGERLAAAFREATPELQSLAKYLAHLKQYPLDWPAKQ